MATKYYQCVKKRSLFDGLKDARGYARDILCELDEEDLQNVLFMFEYLENKYLKPKQE